MTIDISILLPTRGRTNALADSVLSLVENSAQPERVEYLLAFDNDDQESYEWFEENVAPKIDAAGSTYTCIGFEPIGYVRLNEYVNHLAKQSSGRWLMFWNDDAIMHSKGWDTIVAEQKDFAVLRIPTHNEHPYAIFPIVPKEWYEIFGYLSAHQISDAWISQIGYLLDIVVNIPIEVTHDRHDLTGNNKDETYTSRIMLEGNPDHPFDFNYIDWRRRRIVDASKIAQYLNAQGRDMTWFENVMNKKQDPWEKMTGPEYDPNQQLKRYE